MTDFNSLARADVVRLENTHELYRTFEVPGLRDSERYEGTGIEETHNLAFSDKSLPTDQEAVPSLHRIRVGDTRILELMDKEVEYHTLKCPECDLSGRVTESALRVCPQCGLVLTRGDAQRSNYDAEFGADGQPIERTPAAAGRFNE